MKPDEWTSDNAPKVIFDNLTDEKAVIKAAGIKYALKPEGELPGESDFKAPENLSISSESGIYSGSL